MEFDAILQHSANATRQAIASVMNKTEAPPAGELSRRAWHTSQLKLLPCAGAERFINNTTPDATWTPLEETHHTKVFFCYVSISDTVLGCHSLSVSSL